MLKHGFFTFHIVEMSPWPLLSSLSIMISMIGWLEVFGFMKFSLTCLLGNILLLLMIYGWMRDIIRESTFEGNHSLKVQSGLKMGFLLFIISEIFFFLSFFWGLYYSSVTPYYGWPTPNIKSVDPYNIPLLGTMILLSSGVSITWCHHSMMEKKNCFLSLLITILLGLTFTLIQLIEYYETTFTIADGVFGSFFFVSTGFHGIHVMVGSIFLLYSLVRIMKNHFSFKHHLGFEAAAWYWHFVDVVWLFLFISAYWWSF